MAGPLRAASLGKRLQALALTPVLIVVTLGVGWLVWSTFEWRRGRTPGYRLVGLRVVRASDARPLRFGRSLVRCSICLVMVVPTIVTCCVIGVSFVFGASAPDDLFRRPRPAPWDTLTDARVVFDDPAPSQPDADRIHGLLRPIDLSRATRPSGTQNNGHAQ